MLFLLLLFTKEEGYLCIPEHTLATRGHCYYLPLAVVARLGKGEALTLVLGNSG